METDNKSSGRAAAQTIHVDAMVVAAWNTEAHRTGRTVEAVVRETLNIPAGRLVVVVVDMTAALDEQFRTGAVKPGRPWPELLQAAFADSLRQPPEGQL